MSQRAEQGKEKKQYVIFIGNIREEFSESPVKAKEIMHKAGAEPPSEFVLEALHGRGGKVEVEYAADDDVDLGPGEEKFFRVVPRGGGRA